MKIRNFEGGVDFAGTETQIKWREEALTECLCRIVRFVTLDSGFTNTSGSDRKI